MQFEAVLWQPLPSMLMIACGLLLTFSLSLCGAARMGESWLENQWLEAPGPSAPGYKGSTLSVHSLSHPSTGAWPHCLSYRCFCFAPQQPHTQTMLTQPHLHYWHPHLMLTVMFILFSVTMKYLVSCTPHPPPLFVMACEPGYDSIN